MLKKSVNLFVIWQRWLAFSIWASLIERDCNAHVRAQACLFAWIYQALAVNFKWAYSQRFGDGYRLYSIGDRERRLTQVFAARRATSTREQKPPFFRFRVLYWTQTAKNKQKTGENCWRERGYVRCAQLNSSSWLTLDRARWKLSSEI